MRTYTNLAWPEDPYRTGQQLYRRPAPRLAAFCLARTGGGGPGCQAAAIVYLPLHRTRTLAVTSQTVAFGFHAASISTASDSLALAVFAGLDLLQARRHAAVLTGHLLAGDLAALRPGTDDLVPRGIAALEHEWAQRHTPASGKAAMLDCGLDLPGNPALPRACRQAGISASTAEPVLPVSGEAAAAAAVHRALVIALVAARHLGRYVWEGILPADDIVAAGAWDCFPQPPSGQPRAVADPSPRRLARLASPGGREPE